MRAGASGFFAALACVCVAWVAFWWPVITGGEVLFLRDLVAFAIPSKSYLLERWASGEWPLWTPRVSAGLPFLADPAHQVFYPLNLLVAAADDVAVGVSRFIVTHHLIGMAAMVWLARALGFGAATGAWMALVYGLCGYNVSITDNVTYAPAVAWVPTAVAAFLACAANRRHVASAALAVAMLVLVGDLPDAAIVTAFGLTVAAWRAAVEIPPRTVEPAPPRWRPGRHIVAIALALALAAVQIAPTAELVEHSVRALGLTYEEATIWSLPPSRLVELAQPHAFGAVFPAQEFAGEALYPVNGSPWAASIFLGWVPLFFAFLAAWFHPRRVAVWLVLVAVSLLLGFGRHAPYYPWLLEVFPVFGTVRYPEKYVFWSSFALVVLAGFGVEGCLARAESARRAFLRIGVLRLLLVIVVGGWAALFFLVELPVAVRGPESDVAQSAFWSARFGFALSHLQGLLAHTALTFTVFAVASLLVWHRPRSTLAFLMVFAFCDLWWMHRSSLPIAPAALFAGDREPHALRVLRSLGYRGGDRILVDTLRPEYRGDIRLDPLAREIAAAVPTERYPHAPALGWIYASMLQRERLRPDAGVAAGVHYLNGDYSPLRPLANETFERSLLQRAPGLLASLASVRWVIAHDELRSELWNDPALIEVHRDPVHHLRIFEVRDSLPFVRLVTGAHFVEPGGVVGPEARSSGIDHRREALIERAEPADPMEPSERRVRVTLVERAAERIVVEVESDADRAFLVVNESYYPGWTATVSGMSAPVERANLRFMAVEVPRGLHRVELTFRSARFETGALVSVVALVLTCSIFVAGSGAVRRY